MAIQNAVRFVKDLSTLVPRPWLIVGKGPSVDFITRVDPAEYHVLTLNHACRVISPTIAHFVDLEAFLECSEALADHETPTCLPYHPHVACKPSEKTLVQYCGLFGEPGKSIPLAWLLAKDKLLSYNATTASKLRSSSSLPTVRLRHFGAVGAFNLLAQAGVSVIHSIGVDGGTGYAEAFDAKDKLANGRKSFDAQLPEIEKTVKAHKIAWTKLSFG